MTLGMPQMRHLLWLVPLVAGCFLTWRLRSRAQALAALGPLVSTLTSRGTARVHRVRAGLATLGLFVVTLGLAQPRWGFLWVELQRRHRCWRWTRAGPWTPPMWSPSAGKGPPRGPRPRRPAAGRPGGWSPCGAHPDVPLTLDYDAAHECAGTRPLDGSPRAPTSRAASTWPCSSSANRPKRTALIILSDGEDHSQEARAAAQAAADQGIHLYTLGIGTPDGAPVPLVSGGFVKDNTGGRSSASSTRARHRSPTGVTSGPARNQDMTAIYDQEIRMRSGTQ